MKHSRVLIAKTTHLGDLVISLPMAASLKQFWPDCRVFFLTQSRTRDVAERCLDVDEVHILPESFDDLVQLLVSLRLDVFIQVNTSHYLAKAAKSAQIPMRIGSAFRWYNWAYCNHRVAISRGYKNMNKRLLDLEYLKPLGLPIPKMAELPTLYRFSQQDSASIIDKFGINLSKRRIILHPTLITAKAHQWPLAYYESLMREFDKEFVQWIITGTKADRAYLGDFLNRNRHVDLVDTVGLLTLDELLTLMQSCDGLVAGNTGPVHLAGALGLKTVGLYQSNVAVTARWAAVGSSVTLLQSAIPCIGDKAGSDCSCVKNIHVNDVVKIISTWFEQLV